MSELPVYAVGTRWRSVVCDTEVVIIRATAECSAAALKCGGWPMVPFNDDQERKPVLPPFDKGSQLGKRYQDPSGMFALLCTKGGAGSLALGESVMAIDAPRPLPASD